MVENPDYLSSQFLTYIGKKGGQARSLMRIELMNDSFCSEIATVPVFWPELLAALES
jgi:hypothetical protein